MPKEADNRSIEYYQRDDETIPYIGWVNAQDVLVRARFYARLARVELGNFGDCEPVGDGVHELRIHFGPGYRIYFGEIQRRVILLLGGTKRTQKRDI